MHRRAFGLLACLLAAALAAPGAADAVPAGKSFASRLDQQAGIWAQGLAAQPGFERFAEAKRKVMPLGPGTHGWLVLFEDRGNVIGYMVVHAAPDGGFQLTEYGLGGEPLFAANLLRQGLARLDLIDAQNDDVPGRIKRLYAHPLGAAWRIETEDGIFYLDAKTGEELPADDVLWRAEQRSAEACMAALAAPEDPAGSGKSAGGQAAIKPVRAAYVEPFDPYGRLPWLTRAPLDWSGADPAALLEGGGELRLVSERFDGAFLYVLPVAAWHEWDDGSAYVGVEQAGLRFIPQACLETSAQLYD